MEFTIDCASIGGPREFHAVLADTLNFPEWYGSNLDALHDCLTALTRDTRLLFHNWDAVAGFAPGFRRVLTDAARENPKLTVVFA